MELSERCIAQLEKEGYPTVYEEQLLGGQSFPIPSLDMAVFVSEGTLVVHGSTIIELLPGDRYKHSPLTSGLQAGAEGCQLVIGEGKP